jgi:hypothetical protein
MEPLLAVVYITAKRVGGTVARIHRWHHLSSAYRPIRLQFGFEPT